MNRLLQLCCQKLPGPKVILDWDREPEIVVTAVAFVCPVCKTNDNCLFIQDTGANGVYFECFEGCAIETIWATLTNYGVTGGVYLKSGPDYHDTVLSLERCLALPSYKKGDS